MTDLSALERLARSATPGRYEAVNLQTHLGKENEHIAEWVVTDARNVVAHMTCPPRPDNARFIAAASPDVVLELIARIRELEAQVDRDSNAAFLGYHRLLLRIRELEEQAQYAKECALERDL